jgi:hypothetical protein
VSALFIPALNDGVFRAKVIKLLMLPAGRLFYTLKLPTPQLKIPSGVKCKAEFPINLDANKGAPPSEK